MTTEQEYDLLSKLISVAIPGFFTLLGVIIGVFLSPYFIYREKVSNYRIDYINSLQGAIRDSLTMIKVFLKVPEEVKSLKEPLVRSSLIYLRERASLYIRNGFSIEMMRDRKGNLLLYRSVVLLDWEMRNYDADLTEAELTDSGLKGIEKLLRGIERNYKRANYEPDNIFSYIIRQTKTSIIRGK